MAKWNCWFGWAKSLFTSETKEKKPKKWGWCIGRFKLRQHPKLTAPNRTLTEAREEQRKHALTVAIATAAAAEAAVAAAHAAAEVVRLTGASSSYHYLSKGDRTLAAIKIQSAYRGHLARKALRALKGVVRLQALVRGQVVRRQVFRNLRQLPSNARNQVEIQERSGHTEGEIGQLDETNRSPKKKNNLEEKETKPESHSQRTWDCSSQSKEDIEAIWLRKQEAIAKRERMKQYSFSHRERKFSHIVEESVSNGRESCRTLGQWLDEEACKHDMLYKPTLQSYVITRDLCGTAQVAQKSVEKEDSVEEELSSQILFPRKSFSHIKKSSLGDDSSMPNSPVFPTYMAVTESTKAKVRSMSTPRQRPGFLGICSNQNEPLKEGLSLWSSHYGATTSTKGNTDVSRQRCQSVNRHYYR